MIELFSSLFNELKRLFYVFLIISVSILSLAYYTYYDTNIELSSEMEVYPITKVDTLFLDKYLLDLNKILNKPVSISADITSNILKDFHPNTIIELVWQNLREVNIKQLMSQTGIMQNYSSEIQDEYLSIIENSFVANIEEVSHDSMKYYVNVKSFNEKDTKIILDTIFAEAENLSKIQISEIFNFYNDYINEMYLEELQLAENRLEIIKNLENSFSNNLLFEKSKAEEKYILNYDEQDYVLLKKSETSLANSLGLVFNLNGYHKNDSIPNYFIDLLAGSAALENELNIIKNKKNKTGMLLKNFNLDQINNKIQSMRMISYNTNSIFQKYSYNKNVVMIISVFISILAYILICLISLAYREKI